MELLDATIVSVAAPAIAADLGAGEAAAAVDAGRVHALCRSRPDHRWPHRRLHSARRRVFLLGLAAFMLASAGCAAGAEFRCADRHAGRARPGRRTDDPAGVRHHPRLVRARRTREGARRLRGRARPGLGDRTAARWSLGRSRPLRSGLAGDLLGERSDRDHRADRGSPIHARVPGAGRRPAGPAGRGPRLRRRWCSCSCP